MKLKRYLTIPLAISLLAFTLGNTGCPDTPEEKASLKKQAVSKVDSLANSLKLAQGVTEDLHKHEKISDATAIKVTENLRKANGLGKQLGDKVKAIDPNAASLPMDLSSYLDDIEKALRNLGVGQDDLVKAIQDSLAIVWEIRRMLK